MGVRTPLRMKILSEIASKQRSLAEKLYNFSLFWACFPLLGCQSIIHGLVVYNETE